MLVLRRDPDDLVMNFGSERMQRTVRFGFAGRESDRLRFLSQYAHDLFYRLWCRRGEVFGCDVNLLGAEWSLEGSNRPGMPTHRRP